MDSVLSMGWTAIAALALTGVGLLGAAWSQLGRDDSRTRRAWARYVVLLDRDVSFLRLEIAAPDRLDLIGDRPQVIRVMPGIDIHVGRTPPLRPRIFANALCCAGGVFRFHCWSGLYGRTPGF